MGCRVTMSVGSLCGYVNLFYKRMNGERVVFRGFRFSVPDLRPNLVSPPQTSSACRVAYKWRRGNSAERLFHSGLGILVTIGCRNPMKLENFLQLFFTLTFLISLTEYRPHDPNACRSLALCMHRYVFNKTTKQL